MSFFHYWEQTVYNFILGIKTPLLLRAHSHRMKVEVKSKKIKEVEKSKKKKGQISKKVFAFSQCEWTFKFDRRQLDGCPYLEVADVCDRGDLLEAHAAHVQARRHVLVEQDRQVGALRLNFPRVDPTTHVPKGERKNKYFYRPQRSCGQGNIFTPVCHSVQGGWWYPTRH